jgi:hypothetical protein
MNLDSLRNMSILMALMQCHNEFRLSKIVSHLMHSENIQGRGRITLGQPFVK